MKELWDYLDEVSKSGVKQRSVDLYRRDLGLFGLFLLKKKKKGFCEAMRDDIEEYLSQRKAERSGSAYYSSFTRIRAFYESLVKKGVIAENPAGSIKDVYASSLKGSGSK